MNFGVIGAAHNHIYEFIEDMLSLNGEFKGIYDDQSEYVKPISEKYQVPIYSNLEDLFEEGIQVAGTSAVNDEKINIIEECSRHNVHILADKPIVVNEEGFQRLEQVIAEGNVQVGLMLTVRFMSPIHTLKKIIDEGEIGRLLSIEIFNPHRLAASERPDWHFKKEQNGGIVVDLMVHSIDLYNWLAETEIAEYTGTITKSILQEKEDFYDSAQFFIQGRNGVTGYLRVDWHMTDTHWNWGDFRVFCTGTSGMVEVRALGDPISREVMVILFKQGEETKTIRLDDLSNSAAKDFVNRIQGKDHVITHEDIMNAVKWSIEFDREARKIRL